MSRPRRHPSERSRRRFTDATWLDDLPDIDAVDEDAARPDEAEEAPQEVEGKAPADAASDETAEPTTPAPRAPAPRDTPRAPIAGPPGREPRDARSETKARPTLEPRPPRTPEPAAGPAQASPPAPTPTAKATPPPSPAAAPPGTQPAAPAPKAMPTPAAKEPTATAKAKEPEAKSPAAPAPTPPDRPAEPKAASPPPEAPTKPKIPAPSAPVPRVRARRPAAAKPETAAPAASSDLAARDPFAAIAPSTPKKAPEPTAPAAPSPSPPPADPFADRINTDAPTLKTPPPAAPPAPEATPPAPTSPSPQKPSKAPAPSDPFTDRIRPNAPASPPPKAKPAAKAPSSPKPPEKAPASRDPFADHMAAGPPRAPAAPKPAPPKSAPRPAKPAVRALPPVAKPEKAPAAEANEPSLPPMETTPPAKAPKARPAPTIRAATHLGVPAVIWERGADAPPTSPETNGVAAQGNGAMAFPPPSPVPSAPDPLAAPSPQAPGDCDLCGTPSASADPARCPVCRRDTCGSCRDGAICTHCTDLRVADAAERATLAPLRLPADGVRITPPGDVRVVTIESGSRRELAVMRDGMVERWWRSDRAEPNHYRVNRALEAHLGLRDAAGLRVLPLNGAGEGERVLQVGGEGQLVAEITSVDADGGIGAPETIELDTTPPGPSGLVRALAEQFGCDEDPVPWVVPSGLRRHFERLVPPVEDETSATITLEPRVRRSGVRVSERGLVETNGGVAPFAPIEPNSAAPLGGRLSVEWFPPPRAVAAARGVSASAVLLEIGGNAVLAIQNGDDVSYHASAVPEPSVEEIIGGALHPDGLPAQASATIDPAEIGASGVINAQLESRRARPIARPSSDWASTTASAAAIARFRLDQAVRMPHVELDLPVAVAVALRTELMRGGARRPEVLEIGAEVREHWQGRESASEHVYEIYAEDLDLDGPGRADLVLDDEGHFATHARRCCYCATTRCDECTDLVRSCIICKIDLCANCRGPATIGLPVCPACSSLARSEAPRKFGRRKTRELMVGTDGVHEVAVERGDEGWYLLAPDGTSRLPIARDYRVAGYLERRLDS